MIQPFKPYPDYKPSGVEWLGDVPEHWEVRRLKTRVENVSEQTKGHNNGGLYLALEHVESWTGKYEKVEIDSGLDSQVKQFQSDDVLFCKLRPYLAKVVRPNCPGVCVSEFLVLRPSDDAITARYLEHLLRSKPVIDAVDASTFGAKMPRADWQFIGTMRYPNPPLSEQTAIAAYLDDICGKIHRHIEAKERLVKLLEEYRRALIHRTVTRGLDPNVPLKPSGIEWLGNVPAHWEVLSNRAIFNEANEQNHPQEEMLSVTIADGVIRQQTLLKDSSKKDISRLDRSVYKLVRTGDIVYNKMRAWQGAVGVSKYEGIVSPAYVVQRPREKANSHYLHYLLRTPAFITEAQRWSYGIASDMWSLRAKHFKAIYVCVPPPTEQSAIVSYLDKKTADIDAAIHGARQEITLLREYRTRLIADVVTGKVDVRGKNQVHFVPVEPRSC